MALLGLTYLCRIFSGINRRAPKRFNKEGKIEERAAREASGSMARNQSAADGDGPGPGRARMVRRP